MEMTRLYDLPKEQALPRFLDMVRKSWTWARLTDTERRACTEALTDTERAALRGTMQARWEILHAVYFAFLAGTGYSPDNWREPDAGEEAEA